MQIISQHQLSALTKTDDLVYVSCSHTWSLQDAKYAFNARRVLDQRYTPYLPSDNPEESDYHFEYADLKTTAALLAFLSNYEADFTLKIYSPYKQISLSLLITAILLREKLSPEYAIAEAVKDHLETKPAVWLIALVDYKLDLNGKLVNSLEEYLATGITVTNRAQLLKADWATD
jgi:predicted protein tyrosine phosphatase